MVCEYTAELYQQDNQMNFMTQVVEFSTDQATTPDKVRDSSPTNVFIVIIIIISHNIHK